MCVCVCVGGGGGFQYTQSSVASDVELTFGGGSRGEVMARRRPTLSD